MRILVALIVLWSFFGEPSDVVANVFWSESAAPWEDVDVVVYYRDLSGNSHAINGYGLGSVEECREWAASKAMRVRIHGLTYQGYSCGIGEVMVGGFRAYRVKVD